MNGPGDRILLVHPHHLHSATIVRRGDNGTIIAQDEAGAEWQAEAIPAYHILSSSSRLSSPSLGQPPPNSTIEHVTSAIEGFKASTPSEAVAAMREETSSDTNSPSARQSPAKAKRAGKTKRRRDMPGN